MIQDQSSAALSREEQVSDFARRSAASSLCFCHLRLRTTARLNALCSTRWLSTADGPNNFTDCADHELRLFLVYFMAAFRVGDVLFVRHKFRQP